MSERVSVLMEFVDILSVDDELKDKVRRWRNKKEVNRFMVTQHHITRDEHFKWIKSLGERDDQKSWLVFVEDIPIGSISLRDMNYEHQSCELGIYIGEDAYRGHGFGKQIVYKTLKYVFGVLDFNVLIAKVFADNMVALNFYRKLGFKESGEPVVNNGRELITMRFFRSEGVTKGKEFANAVS